MQKMFFLLLASFISFGNKGDLLAQPSSDYRLIFDDEFNDGVLDWRIDDCTTHGTNECEESMFYMKENVSETAGVLRLTAKREVKTCNGRTKYYTSGQVISPTDFQYGYFEIRAKLPHGNGFWPAFWFWTGCSQGAYREIDVFEFCGCDCTDFKSGFFYEDDYNSIGADHIKHKNQEIDIDGNGCDAFHTYGVEWTPSNIDFYLDGVKKFSNPNININIPMPVILNLAINGCWGGCGWTYCGFLTWDTDGSCHVTCGTNFPAYYDIDYFKVWQKRNQAVYIKGPAGLCVNQKGTYYTSMVPGATYSWSSPTGLQINEIPWDNWGCTPPGVHKQVDVTASTPGWHTLQVTVTFPTGYTETKSIQIKVDAQAPTAPTGISFLFDDIDCCYYPYETGSSYASYYEWNYGGYTYTSTTTGAPICLQPGYQTISVKAVNSCGASQVLTVEQYLPVPFIPGCNQKMQLVPNPTNGQFRVEIFNNDQLSTEVSGLFQIYDAYGNLKYSTELTQNDASIDATNLPNGTYNAVLLAGSKVITQVFVKNDGY